MKRILSLLCVFIFFIACDNPKEKSVLEPLTADELSSILKKDSTFKHSYEIAEMIRTGIDMPLLEESGFRELTYSRFQKFYNENILFPDTAQNNKFFEAVGKDWEAFNEIQLSKIDSISDFWKKAIQENPEIQLPRNMDKYWEAVESNSNEVVRYRDYVLERNLPGHKERFQYVNDRYFETMRAKDPLSFNFVKLTWLGMENY